MNDEATIDRLIGKYPNILTEDIKAENIKYPLEGYLFPATYPFYEENPSVETIVDAMVQATASNVTPYLDYLQKKREISSLVINFCVTCLKKKRQHNQIGKRLQVYFTIGLKIDMPLQTDPTVLYALGEHKDRVLVCRSWKWKIHTIRIKTKDCRLVQLQEQESLRLKRSSILPRQTICISWRIKKEKIILQIRMKNI